VERGLYQTRCVHKSPEDKKYSLLVASVYRGDDTFPTLDVLCVAVYGGAEKSGSPPLKKRELPGIMVTGRSGKSLDRL